eukprot:SAG11_NODE_7617_length_1120_cov_3.296768_1_plen_42_part_10
MGARSPPFPTTEEILCEKVLRPFQKELFSEFGQEVSSRAFAD